MKEAAIDVDKLTQADWHAAFAAHRAYVWEHSIEWAYNDGGRADAGYKGTARDCVCRAIAIAAQIPYQEVYQRLNALGASERTGKRKKGKSSASTGVYKQAIVKYLRELGWTFVPLMGIGTGCKVHLRNGELPMGRLIVSLSRHYAAVINGVLNDLNEEVSRDGTRCVYGYWIKSRR